MTNKELKVIADVFSTPCEYSPMDEFVLENIGEWCEKNCGHVSKEQCWRKYIKTMLEKQNEQDK